MWENERMTSVKYTWRIKPAWVVHVINSTERVTHETQFVGWVRDFSVWPFWSGDISVVTFLYINN